MRLIGLSLGFAILALVTAAWSALSPASNEDTYQLRWEPRLSELPQSAAVTDTVSALDVCSQHAPKCPLTEAFWPGEPGGWQITGKKWSWYPRTPRYKRRISVWEYSLPYQGNNPDYAGQREDHYADFSNSPDGYPQVEGRPPETYDWERWQPEANNYRMMQLGSASEEKSYLVGEADCTAGVYYPVLDQNNHYFYTPMFTTRWGTCTGGGYVSAYLYELWGQPLSQQRAELCDNWRTGVPAEYSPEANLICKLSPYVGTVYQRYVFGPESAGDRASLGCEAVLYAWGWSEPQGASSGQDYQVWFRNGELRFSRWWELSNQAPRGEIPAPDDHEWWNSKCEGAWTKEANWIYTGVFRTGENVYRDQVSLPTQYVVETGPDGGTYNLSQGNLQYVFPPATFAEPVSLVHFFPVVEAIPSLSGLISIDPPVWVVPRGTGSEQDVQPQQQFMISYKYEENQRGTANEDSLGIYTWDGKSWVREITSHVDTEANLVTAFPDHFSLWALLGQPYRVYLPRVRLNQ